jgi:hypothetical protein
MRDDTGSERTRLFLFKASDRAIIPQECLSGRLGTILRDAMISLEGTAYYGHLA